MMDDIDERLNDFLQPILITLGIGLIAFVIVMVAIAARRRKTPAEPRTEMRRPSEP